MCMTHGQNQRLPVLWSARHCHILHGRGLLCKSKYCLSMRMPVSVRALLQILFALCNCKPLAPCVMRLVFVCMKAVLRHSPGRDSSTVDNCVGFSLHTCLTEAQVHFKGKKESAHTVAHSLRRQHFSVSCTPLPKECMLLPLLLILTEHRQTWSTLYSNRTSFRRAQKCCTKGGAVLLILLQQRTDKQQPKKYVVLYSLRTARNRPSSSLPQPPPSLTLNACPHGTAACEHCCANLCRSNKRKRPRPHNTVILHPAAPGLAALVSPRDTPARQHCCPCPQAIRQARTAAARSAMTTRRCPLLHLLPSTATQVQPCPLALPHARRREQTPPPD